MRESIVVIAVLATLLGCDRQAVVESGAVETERSAWTGPAPREAWLVAEVEAHNAGLSEDDRAAKYCKMAASPFVFYRGSNHLFWRDLAGDGRFADFGGDADTRIWLQGDLHAENFGAFANDADAIVYDLNDFDEVVIADYQWDVWRMATSIALLAEQNGGFSTAQIDGFVGTLAESYLDAMAGYRGNDQEIARSFGRLDTYGLLDDFLLQVETSESRAEMLGEWTLLQAGVRVFNSNHAELGPVDPTVEAELRADWSSYVALTAGGLAGTPGYFTIKDVAARLDAGTGSLGTPRYYVLIEGSSGAQSNDRILDVKRQGEPSGYAWLSPAERAQLDGAIDNQAERTLAGQRALTARADDHLGWLALADGFYGVRERSPYKASFSTSTLDTVTRFTKLAEQWGTILATNHARADKDHRAEVISHSLDMQVDQLTDGSHAEFRALVLDVVRDYEQQVHLDYAAFAAFVDSQYSCVN